MKNYLFTLLFLMFSLTFFAQKKVGKIYGKIVGATEILPFATVVLKTANNKLIEGVVTGENGEFSFNKIANGNYIVEAQYIGFDNFVKNVLVSDNQRLINLGSVVMKEKTSTLDEVVVQGKTSEVSLKLGKKVFRVSKDLTAQNGSATDVLSNVPSVSVSPNGQVSLRGNSNVQVMINGRRSAMTQSQALEQLPADIIERVEVITNPSAQYDASGSSGIINIVLKKNEKSGLNGQIRLVAGIPSDYRAYGNINYKIKKFNFFTNLGIRYTDYEGEYSRKQQTLTNGITTFLNQKENEDRHDDGQIFYFGTDYFINEKNTFTVAYYRNETKDTDVTVLDYEYSTSVGNSRKEITNGNSQEKRDYNQLEANYTKLFEKKGQKLTIDFQYDFWNSNKDWQLLNNQVLPVQTQLSSIRTNAKGNTNDFTLQSYFKTPVLKKGTMVIGTKFENRTIGNKFLGEELVNGNYRKMNEFDNSLNYKEQIFSSYVEFSTKKDKFNYQLGVRLETTNVKIITPDVTKNLKNNYTNFFPSATIGYQISNSTSTQISYSKRINRPSLWELSPFYQLKDYTSRFTGNPYLKSAFTNSFELSFLYRKSKFQINPSIYFSDSKDVSEYQTIKDDNDFFIILPINLDKEQRYGLEASASYNFAKWLQLSTSLNWYRFNQKGIINSMDANFTDSTIFGNFSANVKPSNTLRLQARIYFQGAKNNAQTKTEATSMFNFGINKSVFNNRGSISFNVSNAFNTAKQKEQIMGSNYSLNTIRNRNGARFSVGFVYKFNQTKKDRNRRARRSNRS